MTVQKRYEIKEKIALNETAPENPKRRLDRPTEGNDGGAWLLCCTTGGGIREEKEGNWGQPQREIEKTASWSRKLAMRLR